MKKQIVIFPVLFLLFLGCTKKEATRTSGIDTIDNITYFSNTYYNYGFRFSSASLVSTNSTPAPDITVFVITENSSSRLTLQADNLNPSFYLAGEYADEESAITAFDSLKTVSVTTWKDMADPVKPNQVWIYKTGSGSFAKIRIVSTVNETRNSVPYGEVKFQWVFQSDGSDTFSGK